MIYGDLQFFDIIVFAAIAIFLIYRLRSVLGKRTGFEGKIFTSKKFNMPWHKIDVDEIKILPNFLQKFPDNYNILEKTIFKYS